MLFADSFERKFLGFPSVLICQKNNFMRLCVCDRIAQLTTNKTVSSCDRSFHQRPIVCSLWNVLIYCCNRATINDSKDVALGSRFTFMHRSYYISTYVRKRKLPHLFGVYVLQTTSSLLFAFTNTSNDNPISCFVKIIIKNTVMPQNNLFYL